MAIYLVEGDNYQIELIEFNLREGNVTDLKNQNIQLTFRLPPLTQVKDPMMRLFLPKGGIYVDTVKEKVLITKFLFDKICKNKGYSPSDVLSRFITRTETVSNKEWKRIKGMRK